MKYLQNIPLATLEQIFKKSEVQIEILGAILKTFSAQESNSEWIGNFLLSLSKASNFDMTCMFAEDADKTNFETILGQVKKTDASLADKLTDAYPMD